MCRYRCYYYAGCRHQETILHDYCDEATSAPASSAAHTNSPAATSSSSPPPQTQKGGANEDQDVTPRPRSPADIPSPSPTMSTSSSHHTTASNVSIGSSAPTSFASTTEDTSDTASIQLEHPLRRHSEPADCEMASLPPFVRDNLRQFFAGQMPTTATAALGAKHADCDDRENVHPAESAKRHDLDLHMALTTKLVDDRLRLAAEARSRNTSYSSMISNDSEAEFDTVERDIDDLKQQLAEIRSKSRSGHSTPTMYSGHTQSKSMSTRTRIPGPVAQPTESAAARLQREHEKAQELERRSTAFHRAKPPPPPPSPFDFPELGQNNAERRPHAFTADGQQDKPSYANMASTGMLDAVSKGYTASVDTHSSKVGSSGSASRTARVRSTDTTRKNVMAMELYETQQNDIKILSPKSPKCERPSTRGPNSPLVGSSPRFAQPTKAHSQRADATARKDSVTSRLSPVSSPTKSGRALPQLQTRRSALPGGWLGSPEVSPTTELSSPSITGTVDAATPSSKERWQMVGHSSKESTLATEPTLRKKISSYMSPTKATTLRNVATLGQENLKHTSPRVKKPVTRIDTNVLPAIETMTAAASHEPGSAMSGTNFTESAASSPDVAILTESRIANPWNLRQTQTCGPCTSSDLASMSFQPTIRGIETQHGEAPCNSDAALSRALEGFQPATSDPASAVFGHGALRESSASPGECDRTERTLQASRARQQSNTTISVKQAAAGRAALSHALPIVQPQTSQPKTSRPKPMPHKLPASRRSTLGPHELVADDLAAKAKALGYRMPANTVAKRRVSHGHLLTPITNKLESLGLLKRLTDPTNSSTTSQSTPFSTALQQVHQLLPETPDKMPTFVSPPAPAAPQVRIKAVPPHLRRKHNTSTDEDPATCNTGTAASRSVTEERQSQNSHAQSLRATAQEFKPMWKPTTIEEELGLLDWEGWFSYRSPEEWNALHPGIRAAIQAIRDYKCKGGRPATGTFPGMSPTKIRSKTANQRFWADLMQKSSSASNADGLASMTPGKVVAAMQESITQHGAGVGIEAGQVLKPEINPDTNALQWAMQDPDGRQVSVTFGRAAAPTASCVAPNFGASPSTVTISPLSSGTLPRRNESPAGQSSQVFRTPSDNQNRRNWSIASALKDPSGWAIGDGREIRYVGNGNINPGTTYNPVGPPQQGYREGPDQAPRMIGDDQGYGHSSMPLAPRSREQWAKLLSQGRKPCDNIEITHASEQIPFASMDGSKLYGFCGPCSGKTH